MGIVLSAILIILLMSTVMGLIQSFVVWKNPVSMFSMFIDEISSNSLVLLGRISIVMTVFCYILLQAFQKTN